jgi:hypothetical protein
VRGTRLGERLVQMSVHEVRRAGDDDQDVAGADRRLLDDAALSACGVGEQLAPLLVALF